MTMIFGHYLHKHDEADKVIKSWYIGPVSSLMDDFKRVNIKNIFTNLEDNEEGIYPLVISKIASKE